METLSEEDRARGMAIHLVPNPGDLKTDYPSLSDSPVVRSPINNDDPYIGEVPVIPHTTKFPVIFEPIQNLKFSRSVYKITSFLDFSPYVTFFERYEQYISDFLEDMQDIDKVRMIKDPTQVFRDNPNMLLKYFPENLRNMTCDDPLVCRGNGYKFCYQWYVTTCLNRQHYDHMLEEVKYVYQVFRQVRDTFLQAINHVRNNSTDEQDSTSSHPSEIDRRNVEHIEEDMSELIGKNRSKRFLEWGAIAALGYGVYSNAEDIKVIKKNIKILQDENKRQDRNINILAKYLGLTISRVRLHDAMLEKLSTRLIRLEYNLMGHLQIDHYRSFTDMILRDATFTLSRLLSGLTAATQNVDAVYEYLRVMATHKLNPTVVPLPQLKQMLLEIQEGIRESPRLTLPIDPDSDNVESYYDIIRVTPHITQDLLVVLVRVPLTDTSLQMNVFQVHNLPAIHPGLNVSVTYELEGKYLAVGQDGHYLALPDEADISLCLLTGGGLCKMSQALYPSDKVTWCIYALFKQDQKAVNKFCTYNFQKRTGNLAHSLGGYLWAISSVATEKLQVRCLKETHILEITPPLQIVVIGDGCEGYSPSLATTAKNEITAVQNKLSRPSFFTRFNAIYKKNPILGLWNQMTFEALTKEMAEAMVEHLPDLENLPKDAIQQRGRELYEYKSFHLPHWVFLIIGVMGLLIFLVGLGIVIWKVYKMRGAFNTVTGILKEQPNFSGVIQAGKVAKNILNSNEPSHSLAETETSPIPNVVIVPEVHRSDPIPVPAPRRKLNIYKAIEEEFANNPREAKQYLKKIKKMGTIPGTDSETN